MPFIDETEKAMEPLVNGKAVDPDSLPTELMKLLLDDDAGLISFHDTWKGG